VRLPPFAEHPAWGPAPPSRAGVPRAPEPRRVKGLESGRRGREGGKVHVPRPNAGTSPRVVLSHGGGDDGRALAVGSTRCRSAAFDRARGRRKPWRGRGGDRASTRGNGCGGGPRTPCGARTRCRCAVARKARTGLPWEIPLPGGLGTLGGRAWPWALPRQREKGLPGRGVGICGAWSPEGRARAKRVHGGGDSPPGSRRPSRPLPASREGRWPPKRHSHGRPGPGGLAFPVGLAGRCRWLGVVVPAGQLGPRLAGEAKAHPPPRAVEPVPKGAQGRCAATGRSGPPHGLARSRA
jgi:hypothetical protein